MKRRQNSFCVPAALPQGRHRQQFVSSQRLVGLAGAGHAVTRGRVPCLRVLILQGGRKPIAFTAGWYVLPVLGWDVRDGNLCCKTAQVVHEAKFAETRPSKNPCRPQSWAAHPTHRTGQALWKGDGGRDLLWCTATASLGSHRLGVQKQSTRSL